jgi:hypothetical protein
MIRDDRKVIQRAAADLRQLAIRSQYAGMAGQHVTFGLALLLDECALHAKDLPDDLRDAVVTACREISR